MTIESLKLAVLLLLCVATAFGQTQDQKADASVTRLIAQLESQNFRTRQNATRELLKLGAPAIGPLKERIHKGRLELAVRAMSIFESAYVGKDKAAADAADLILEELAESPRQELAELAIGVLEQNYATRAKRTIAKIIQLGGELTVNRGMRDDGARVGPDTTYLVLDKQWVGGVDGLKYIRRLRGTEFQIYIIDGIPVPEKALVELEANFEAPIVARRGPAMLGISGSPSRIGCEISEVTPGKAAAKAGLKTGDIVLEMDGEQIDDFSELVEKLRPMQPKQQIKLKLIRGRSPRPIEITVALDQWKAPGKRIVLPTKPVKPTDMPPGPGESN